jgi:aryl-alcohol dehydrogenase-like predicted oxidoreductase
VFGTASLGRLSAETGKEMLDICEKHGVREIDTAYIYVCFSVISALISAQC